MPLAVLTDFLPSAFSPSLSAICLGSTVKAAPASTRARASTSCCVSGFTNLALTHRPAGISAGLG
jgi:hypothetical protein